MMFRDWTGIADVCVCWGRVGEDQGVVDLVDREGLDGYLDLDKVEDVVVGEAICEMSSD